MSRKSFIKISLTFVIIFSIFSLFLKTTNAAAKYFYWFMDGNNKIELGDDKKGTGFDTKAACEILLKTVGAGLTKSPSCYTGELAKVTSISPAIGKPGDLVTISGDGFNFIKSISFNGVIAEKDGIISSTQTKIMVIVPSGATTGAVTITTTYRGIAKTPVFTINTAGLSWWFTNETKQVVGTKGVHGFPGFTTKELCETAKIPYKSNITSSVSECFQKTDDDINKLIVAEQEASKIFTDEVINKDEAVSVKPQINAAENKTIYKMLAPIGKITCMDSSGKDKNCIGNNIGDYLNVIFKIAIGLCAALAVIMLIISGITYMGNESVFGKTEAKSKMFSAILGLIIALGSYALLNTINPDLTGVKGLNVSAAEIQISSDETSTGSSTSLCLSSNPPNPDSATGTNITLSNEMINEYIPARNQIVGLSTGTKLLITAQTAVEGFKKGTKSYRTNNPGNIGNTDNGATVPYASLVDGIKKQQSIITNVATNNAKSYKIGGKSICALGSEVYNGSLYQYLRIYATGARVDNNYLNAIIGYFKSNGKTITARTTIAEIYAIN